jgi:hypothetical protein
MLMDNRTIVHHQFSTKKRKLPETVEPIDLQRLRISADTKASVDIGEYSRFGGSRTDGLFIIGTSNLFLSIISEA